MRASSPLHALPGSPVLVVLLLFSCAWAAGPRDGAAAPRPPFRVGYRVLDLACRAAGHDRPLTLAVWYPTAAQPSPHTYGGPTRGNVAARAAPLAGAGRFPLLVFSHGYAGSGLGAVFFTEALAARGWIVACPDHHDSHSAVRIRKGQLRGFDRAGLLRDARRITRSGPADRAQYAYRLEELKTALDGILASKVLGKLVDRDRIAAGGHSFGGFTALGLCGTIPGRRDPRIKALLLFSTGAGSYLFRDEELAFVKMPSMLLFGERERGQMRGAKTMEELSNRLFDQVGAPKYLLVVRGASHFAFNNSFSQRGLAGFLGGAEREFDVIRRYGIAFLEKYVAGKSEAGAVLARDDPMLVRRVFVQGGRGRPR